MIYEKVVYPRVISVYNFTGSYGGGSVSGGGSAGGEMVTQEDTIFVSGMDSSTTELDIEKHFGAIGVIKVLPVNLYVN